MANRQTWLRLGVLAAALLLMVTFFLSVSPASAQSEGRIAGIVYSDNNANGVRDSGEDGVFDVRINYSASGWDVSFNTDANGAFSLDVNPATWTVKIIQVPAGYVMPTSSQEVVIAKVGDAVTNIEFALVPNTAATATPVPAGDVLPEAGAPVSGNILVVSLLGVMALGAVLVVVGNKRGQTS